MNLLHWLLAQTIAIDSEIKLHLRVINQTVIIVFTYDQSQVCMVILSTAKVTYI